MFKAIKNLFGGSASRSAAVVVTPTASLAPSVPTFPPVLCRIPDGRLAVIHHMKTDGNLGVRPITNEGRTFPNKSEHWSPEQREAVPEELSLAFGSLVPLKPDEVPQVFR